MNPSLKKRLLSLCLSVICLAWLCAILYTYFDARDEMNEMLDAHLAQASALLAVQASHEIDEIGTEHAPQFHKYALRVAFQIWEEGKILRLHSANAPTELLSPRTEGYSHHTINDVHWRVFSTWDESHRFLIQVAERNDLRAELADDVVENLLRPLLITLPILAILLWLAISHALQPLNLLTQQIQQRAPDNLSALSLLSAPHEVLPLINQLNQLFDKISHAIQKDRRFTADAAHELRTPIAAIKAQAQVAQAATDQPTREKALQQAITGCERASHLIEQLLTLARVDTLEQQPTESCNLEEIASDTIADIVPSALEKNVTLELISTQPVHIQGNAKLLHILLRNLIDNATRHTPAGTTVQISIAPASQQTPIQLTVSDNGNGIPQEERSKVFERFYRPLGTQASGSGLGLSIVKLIADLHTAEVSLDEVKNGHGLQVTVSFK